MDVVPPVVLPLTGSLGPLREMFNRTAGNIRLLALLSPTCEPCLFGARALQTAILDTYPDAPLAVSVVWLPMLQSDSEAEAHEAAHHFSDPRVHQFYDGQRIFGKAVAASLGHPDEVAWDMYLFYERRVQWATLPPMPMEWAHQLDPGWADPTRFRWGDALTDELHRTINRFGHTSRQQIGDPAGGEES